MANLRRRSTSWAATIAHARDEIFDTQEETPSITDDVLRQMWEHCFQRAKRYAEHETGRSMPSQTLSWHDVFEADYHLARQRGPDGFCSILVVHILRTSSWRMSYSFGNFSASNHSTSSQNPSRTAERKMRLCSSGTSS